MKRFEKITYDQLPEPFKQFLDLIKPAIVEIKEIQKEKVIDDIRYDIICKMYCRIWYILSKNRPLIVFRIGTKRIDISTQGNDADFRFNHVTGYLSEVEVCDVTFAPDVLFSVMVDVNEDYEVEMNYLEKSHSFIFEVRKPKN